MIWIYVGFFPEIQRQQQRDRFIFLGISFIAITLHIITIITILALYSKENLIAGILNWMQKFQKYAPAVNQNEELEEDISG